MGKHIENVPHGDMTPFLKAFTIAGFFYVWANTFVKLSLSSLILRVVQRNSDSMRIGLWILIAFLWLLAIPSTIWSALECRPLKAVWDYSYPRNRCIPIKVFRNWFYTGSSKCYVVIYSAFKINSNL
jgi:hypothetical protein